MLPVNQVFVQFKQSKIFEKLSSQASQYLWKYYEAMVENILIQQLRMKPYVKQTNGNNFLNSGKNIWMLAKLTFLSNRIVIEM